MPRPTLDDPAIRAWRDQTLYRLLFRASRAETTATLERVRELGYTDVALADTTLLANVDMAGTVISALARRAGITRQAASQRVAALERTGYLVRRSSDSDGRAAMVSRTPHGRALLDDALDIVAELESGYAEILGDKRLDALKSLLSSLLAHIDPHGALGVD
jgi:DNA-binding MarR family transcriptional regulator